jgi:hypothetical protein
VPSSNESDTEGAGKTLLIWYSLQANATGIGGNTKKFSTFYFPASSFHPKIIQLSKLGGT